MFTPPPPPGPPPVRRLSTGSSDTSGSRSTSPIHQEKPTLLEEPSYYMQKHAPDSTMAERSRFLVARDGDEEKALENLLKYTTWRGEHEAIQREQEQKHRNVENEVDVDLYDWIVASQTAMQANQQETTNDGACQWLPRVVRTHVLPEAGRTALDRDGRRILQIFPGQIDDQICSLSTYALAISLYLDRKLDRNAQEKATLLIDLRPGEGWRNISAMRLLPFVKDIVGLLLVMFPERLHRCIVYPLPYALTWMFNGVKKVMDAETAQKLVVLSGSVGQDSPLPLDQLTEYVTRDVALLCENERLAAFTC